MIDLLYIASPSYSGSTLLTFLLNTHPSIGTIGELKWGKIDLETYRCSCGDLLRECTFWRQVEARINARGWPFDLNRPATDFRCHNRTFLDRVVRARIRGAVFESIRDAAVAVLAPGLREQGLVRQLNRAMIEIILNLQGKTVFLDGSKDPVRLKYLHETGDYNIRVIHLVRDGRAVVCSAIKNQGQPPAEAARDWLRTHLQMERLRRRLGDDRIMILRYESLCEDVQSSLQQIYQFAGLPSHTAPEDYRSVPHHILGNRMRLKPAAPILSDESWREMLTAQSQGVFEHIGGRINAAYGYV